MDLKQWITFITAATAANDVSFASEFGDGVVTANPGASAMPFKWLSFKASHNGSVNTRIYMKGVPSWSNWSDPFLDDYGDQYLLFQAHRDYGRITFTGEIWGFAVIGTPTGGLTIQGGTTPCPYGG